MTIYDIISFIAKKQVEYFQKQQQEMSDVDYQRLIGASMALNELRFYILMKTNPHKREDIRKANEIE